MKIYCARPITGLSYEEVVSYFEYTRDLLTAFGYQVLHPMTAKGYLQGEKQFKASGYKNPLSTDHAFTRRDNWMINQCDILYLNLLGSKKVSIGCVMELAWAYDNNKNTIVVMEEDNIHKHGFVLETANVIYNSQKEALDYLQKLATGTL